jgi:hypothetical protein
MKLDVTVDSTALAEQLGRTVSSALAQAASEAARYGSIGRQLKEAADAAVKEVGLALLADPAFRKQAEAALREGFLAGLRAKGGRLASQATLQRALDLAPPSAPSPRPATDEKGGTRP